MSVIPDGWQQAPDRIPYSTGQSETFWVQNVGGAGGGFSLSCWGTNGITCTGTTPSSLSLAPGEQQPVTAYFNVGGPGSAQLWLRASGATSDTGYFPVTVVALPPGPPVVVLKNQNGDNRDRTLCVTTAGGEGAAVTCGDLVVSHGLPAYATMGQERALTIAYNSAQAIPKPLVAAAVTNGGNNMLEPDSVHVELLVNGLPRVAATYNRWGASPPVTRQVAITYDASPDATGLYPFTLLVRNKYTSGSYDATVSDTLIVVNRAQSEFGTGWWLVGVEQLALAQPGNKILWVGGDGSAKVYRNVGTNIWQAATGGFRDTLRYDPGTLTYTRTLRHGIQVKFDAQGRHTQTVNRIGQVSRFTWSGNPSRLTSIQVPPGGGGTTYLIQYDAGGKLDRITDPAGRVLDATVVSNQLTSLVDPDSYGTGFGYDGAGRMTSRSTRRGFATKFVYAKNLRVTQVRIPLNPTTGDTATIKYVPWDERGLAFGTQLQTAVDTSTSYTKVDGPRTDVADSVVLRVDRWGAAAQIIDPIGNVTTIIRGDAALPAAITNLIYPGGRNVRMSWDARLNLLETRDSTLHLPDGQATAVSTWTYQSSNTKDAPDRFTDPEGVVTQFSYNSWGLLSRSVASNGHITDYEFIPSDSLAGLLRAIIERSVPTWDTLSKMEPLADQRTAFGFNRLGNVVSDTSPMQHVRTLTRDTEQRVTDVYDPAGHRRGIVYDQLNRVSRSIEYPHPSDPTFTSPLITRQFWNIDVVDSIVDSTRGVARGYRYDAANRRTREIDDYGHAEAMFYNPAGLIDSIRLRFDEGTTGFVTSFVYDVAGRIMKKRWPDRAPHGADSILYQYDVVGRMLTATQNNRRVTRTYLPNDLVLTEKQANADGSGEYFHTYAYDRAGRRSWYRMGSGSDVDSVWYAYHATSGALRTVGVKWGSGVQDSVLLRWDELGRRDTLIYPSILNTLRVRFAYDGDGLQRLTCGSHTGGPQPGLPDVFDFTVHHKTVDVEGLTGQTTYSSTGLTGLGCGQNTTLQGVVTNTYDSRHQLTSQTNFSGSTQYQYDASRNIVRTTTNTADKIFVIDPGHNRLTKWYYANNPAVGTDYFYDWSGNRMEESPFCPGCNPYYTIGHRGYYYDGLGRMRGSQEQACQQDPQGGCSGTYPVDQPNVCKYDPFGRLFGRCEGFGSTIAYLSYDGDNVVRTAHDGLYYRWSFVHGPGTDDPLLAYWRGNVPENNRYWYYVTDGNGGQLAVGDATGYDMTTDIAYYQNGGKFAGGAKNANSFSIDRNHNPEMVKLSFFRNRFYDQTTGRWTQEDPTGLAGGLNLYAFAANNPVSNSDPFGLKVCFQGTRAQRDSLKSAFEDATNTLITVDSKGCVVTATPRGREGFEEIQQRFQAMISATETFKAVLVDGASGFNAKTLYISINRRGESYYTFLPGTTYACMNLRFMGTLGAVAAHEAVGHGYHIILGGGRAVPPGAVAETEAIRIENQFHAGRGQAPRCNTLLHRLAPVAPADASNVPVIIR